MNQLPNTPQQNFPNEANWLDLKGFILTLTEEPTYKPRGVFDQIVIVVTGGSSRVYIYDITNTTWKSASIT